MKISKLFVFGDSFAAGINKDLNGGYNSEENQEEINFGTQLKKYLDIESVENFGGAGRANGAIAKDVFLNAKDIDTKKDFVIITWSGMFRNFGTDLESERFVPKPFREEPVFMKEIAKNFAYIMNTVIELRSYGINFICTNSFVNYSNIEEYKLPLFPFADEWVEWGMPGNTLFDMANGTFLDDTTDFNEVEKHDNTLRIKKSDNINTCFHPNKNGHDIIAKKLSEYILNGFYKKGTYHYA